MALFGTLALSEWFWPFGPNLDLKGPISQKELGKHQFFCCPPDFTYPLVFETALTLVGIHFFIFGFGQFSLGIPVHTSKLHFSFLISNDVFLYTLETSKF